MVWCGNPISDDELKYNIRKLKLFDLVIVATSAAAAASASNSDEIEKNLWSQSLQKHSIWFDEIIVLLET